jgi:DNA-directed RNA polymerase subunit RPC12/RpoP
VFFFGHSWAHDSLCKRCGEIRNNLHEWDGGRCSHCGEVLHESSIINWSYHNHKYVFDKKCIKCGKKTTSTEHVPFGKMILGRPIY